MKIIRKAIIFIFIEFPFVMAGLGVAAFGMGVIAALFGIVEIIIGGHYEFRYATYLYLYVFVSVYIGEKLEIDWME